MTNENRDYNKENDFSSEQVESTYNNDYIEENAEQNQYSDEIYYNQREKKSNGKLFLTVLSAFLLGATSVFGAQAFLGTKASSSTVESTKQEQDNQQITVNAVSKAKDAVVSIVNYQQGSSNSSNLLQGILGKSNSSSELKPAGSGSGVIYKKEGNTAYLVTNNHVIDGAKKLTAVLSDGTSVDAQLVGTDVWTDLAVLKIDGTNVTTTMDFANSDKVAVGETALAIGSPLDINLSNTVTKGIISAVNRQIPMDIDKDGNPDWYQTVLQTDAAINPGNSGGALINNEGQLIGINEAKISNVSSNVSAEGIGFVIPANEVKLITEQLEKNGTVTRAALGVQLVAVSTLDNTLVKDQLNYNGKTGAVIKSVEAGTPADVAGLKQYDIITKLNDIDIKDVAAVRKYLFEQVKPGDKVKVTYYRDGKENVTVVTVQTLQNN